MAVDQAAAFERTLARIRERYALYFYLPEGMQPGEERSVEVVLTDAARRRYRGGGSLPARIPRAGPREQHREPATHPADPSAAKAVAERPRFVSTSDP